MRYPEQFSEEQIEKILTKLAVRKTNCVNLDTLNTLLLAQLTHIPFDSMDVWATGTCPSLKLDDIYDKFINRNRGGYCFELNTFFRSLLNGLGFDAYQVIAYILNPDGTQQPPAHNVILCNLGGKKYFFDVGYGGPVPYEVLELREGLQNGFELIKKEDTWFVHRVTQTERRPLTAFRDIPVSVNDLIPLNFYVSQRPDIHFRHVIHLNRRNSDGSIYSVDGNEFKIHTADGATVQQLQTVDDLRGIIRDYFYMDPDQIYLRESL